MVDIETPDLLEEIPDSYKLDMVIETLGVLEEKLDSLMALMAGLAQAGEMAQAMMNGGGLGALMKGLQG